MATARKSEEQMKLVKLFSFEAGDSVPGGLKSAELIKGSLKFSEGGVDLEELRKRVRILDALDATKDSNLLLEDADHAKLVEVVKAQKWRIASAELLQVLEAITEAKEPPAVMLPAANGLTA